MPANQIHESVVVDDDNAVWASPVTSLTQRMSDAGLTPDSVGAASATGSAAAAAAAAASVCAFKPALISDNVRFGIDDSNDSLLLFTGVTGAAAAAAAAAATPAATTAGGAFNGQRRRPTLQQQISTEDDDDEEEVGWVLRRPARLSRFDKDEEEDEVFGGDGTPIRSRVAPTFSSSPSEPTLRRRLWSPSAAAAVQPSAASGAHQHRLASVPLTGFSSSPTSMLAPPRPPAPPPMSSQQQQPHRRRSFKRPSPTVATAAAADKPYAGQQLVPQTPQTATPKRRRMTRTPLVDATNAKATPVVTEEQQQQQQSKKPLLHRCTSELSTLTSKTCTVLDSVKVDNAIHSIDSLNLIGNSEQQHSLPTVKERDFGIRYVTSATVSGLVNGEYADRVPSYDIIDCRYPYEFEGGHIRGALNIYKQDDLISKIMDPAITAASTGADGQTSQNRRVLIFHCEFSSERAPKLASFLRQKDRERNAENYPFLHFPEVYVLKGGYKSFYNAHKEDCHPVNYRRMADPAFRTELAAFQRDRLDWERRSSHTRHSRLQRLASCQQLH